MAVEDEPVIAPARDKGLAGLFAALASEASRLMRQEIALARADFFDRLGHLGAGAAAIAAGGVVLFAGVLALLAAAILALALVVPPWAAALIVGGVVSLAGVVLMLKGRHDMSARNLVPSRAIGSLRDGAL